MSFKSLYIFMLTGYARNQINKAAEIVATSNGNLSVINEYRILRALHSANMSMAAMQNNECKKVETKTVRGMVVQ